ncbi:MAG: PEBP family protein [Actinomycetota bacterium]
MKNLTILLIITSGLLLAACGDDDSGADVEATPETTEAPTAGAEPTPEPDDETASASTSAADDPSVSSVTVIAEVWADNWFSLTVNGDFIGEDSVPITTERSFNAETFTFETTLPMTIAIEAKDFKETDSGIEYIGERNQQMGDGGIIAQFTDAATGDVLAVTNSSWSILSVHQAPLDKSCEQAADPDTACEWLIIDPPTGWETIDFDSSAWTSATEWSEADVSPKDGYDEISWTPSAALIWGTDLEIDNTVLLRTVVG